MRANDLKSGNAVLLDGQLFVAIKCEHTKPGKGPAYIQAKLKNVASGSYLEKRFGSTETIEGATIDRREMEYLYSAGDDHTFMDLENYEQAELASDILGDAMLYCKPNTKVTVLTYDGTPLSLELPASVELEVTDTAPGIKGATATNQLKEATLETGLKTRVPPFIANGEVVRIATTDGSYQSRANA